MDRLALSKDWGNRNNVKVARIPAGTKIKYVVGTAREQLLIADPSQVVEFNICLVNLIRVG